MLLKQGLYAAFIPDGKVKSLLPYTVSMQQTQDACIGLRQETHYLCRSLGSRANCAYSQGSQACWAV